MAANSAPDRLGFGEDQRSGGSLPSLKPGEILGAGALVECFTGWWGEGFGRGVWLGFPRAEGPSSCGGTSLALLAIVVSPGPRRLVTYPRFAGFAAGAITQPECEWLSKR